VYPFGVPITYGDSAHQLKHDAARIIHESGQQPLKNAIACALRLRQSADLLQKAIDAGVSDEDRGKLALALARCLPDEFAAWIKIAEFIHAKPRHIELSGSVTLEQLLKDSWDEKPRDMIGGPANG
jgi:hypothetical protein